ncbi:uncharacterized protein LOC144094600 [Amblyomma americanum]
MPSAEVTGHSRQLYSVHMPTLTSHSSQEAGYEPGDEAALSGQRRLMKGRSMDSLDGSLDSGSSRSSAKSTTAMRQTRILGVPLTYYALLLGSMALCAFSYTFASKSMHDRKSVGHAHRIHKGGPGSLLKAPASLSSSTHGDLAATQPPEQPRAAVAGGHRGGRRRHSWHSARSKRPKRRTTATTAATTGDTMEDLPADLAPLAPWEPPDTEAAPTTIPEPVTTTTTTKVTTTEVTTTASTTTPPPPTVTNGGSTQSGTFNSSVNLDEYEEVFEYYYVYDDNDTTSSSTRPPTQYAEYLLPIN